jgi:alpha-beta hydrolase superfamily lysophospholipase
MSEHREFSERTYDGIKLYARVDAPVDPKAVIVIVHGLCEHQGRYDYVTDQLVAAGYKVYRFDHRGHGRSEGERVYYDDHTQIIRDTDIFVDVAHAENPGLKVFLLGHSMGGYAVALYGTVHASKIDGIVMSGALTRDNKGFAAAVASGLDPHVSFPNELADGVCSDPEVGRAYMADPLVEKTITASIMYMIRKGSEFLKEHPQDFVDPVLILHGCDDGLVANKDSLEFFEQIASTDKSLRIYPKLFHEILNEPVRDRVIRDITDWLGDHI